MVCKTIQVIKHTKKTYISDRLDLIWLENLMSNGINMT